MRLNATYDRGYPSTDNREPGNRAILFIVSLVLFLVSAIFLKYGIWNLYDGPCDWRVVASLIIGWFPFAVGVYLLVYGVF